MKYCPVQYCKMHALTRRARKRLPMRTNCKLSNTDCYCPVQYCQMHALTRRAHGDSLWELIVNFITLDLLPCAVCKMHALARRARGDSLCEVTRTSTLDASEDKETKPVRTGHIQLGRWGVLKLPEQSQDLPVMSSKARVAACTVMLCNQWMSYMTVN